MTLYPYCFELFNELFIRLNTQNTFIALILIGIIIGLDCLADAETSITDCSETPLRVKDDNLGETSKYVCHFLLVFLLFVVCDCASVFHSRIIEFMIIMNGETVKRL